MIIKSMSRKRATFGQLLDYFVAPPAEEIGPPWTHNLLSAATDRDGIRREFFRNAQLLPRRKNGNVLFHEVLSFAAEDAELVTPALLEDLTRQYLERRAPYALAYGVAHFNSANPHVHLLISANNLGSTRRLRLSKQHFLRVQQEMQALQQEQYPLLIHSVAQTRQRLSGATRGERELKRRQPLVPTHKETLKATVSTVLTTATSGSDAYQQLLAHELRLYQRGKTVGVEDLASGKRYRLRTLGLDTTFRRAQEQWQRLPEQLSALPAPQPRRDRDRPHRGWRSDLDR